MHKNILPFIVSIPLILIIAFNSGCNETGKQLRESRQNVESQQEQTPEPDHTPEIHEVEVNYHDIWVRNATGTWELLDSCTDVREENGNSISAEGCKSDYTYTNLTMPLRFRDRVEIVKVTY